MLPRGSSRLYGPRVDCESNVGVGIPGSGLTQKGLTPKRRPVTNTVTGLCWPFQIVTPGIRGQPRASARRAVTRPSRAIPYL